jgi:hypothetical protein
MGTHREYFLLSALSIPIFSSPYSAHEPFNNKKKVISITAKG